MESSAAAPVCNLMPSHPEDRSNCDPVKLEIPPGLGDGLCNVGTTAAEDPALAIQLEKEFLAYENRVLQERVFFAEENAALAHENSRLAEQNALLRAQSQYMWLTSGAVSSDAWGALPPYPLEQSFYWQMHLLQEQQQYFQQQLFSAVSPSQRGIAKVREGVKSNCRSRAGTGCSFGTSTSLGGTSPTASTSGSLATASEDSDDREDHGKRRVPMTTVMMRNIPNNYTRNQLLQLIDNQGFANCYDLVYLPVDFRTEVGLGYAFINFVSAEDAQRFQQHFNGFSSWSVHSSKVCGVTWSDVLQGVHENVERYRNSPVMHETVPDEFKPVLFRNGVRVPFPPPTRKVRAPSRSH